MKRREAKRRKIRLWIRSASAACILIAGILVIVPKQKTEVLPLAGSFYSGNPFCRNEGFAD